MELEFWKLSGAGNDFVVIDNMDGRLAEAGREEQFAAWCRRGMSIGADGVLVIEPAISPDADFRMRYHNADGGEAETCGNGSRCIAQIAHELGIAPSKMRFDTKAGLYDAEVLSNGEVAVEMTDAFNLRETVTIPAADGAPFSGTVSFVNTGVPHVVIFVQDLQKVDVIGIGRYLRYHAAFAPAGTNVNYAQIVNSGELDVRTYERGVEAETLACGTGSIASAIIAERLKGGKTPTRVKTSGGDVLTIQFTPADDGAREVRLQGSAKIVFKGYVETPLAVRESAKTAQAISG